MNLRKRIERLEATMGGDTFDPLVVLFHVLPAKSAVRVTGAEVCKPTARLAMIGAGPCGEAVDLRIRNGETEPAFLSRVEAETIRIWGRLAALEPA